MLAARSCKVSSAHSFDWGRPLAWLYVLYMVGVMVGGAYAIVTAWRARTLVSVSAS